MKKVLIITYYWPPSGGAGVQRWLKFVKYLRQFGWEPIVYTALNAEYPILDESFQKDVPEGIAILRQPIWEPYQLYKKLIGQKKEERVVSGFLREKGTRSWAHNLSIWLRGNVFIPDARLFWIRPSIQYLTHWLKGNPVDAVVSTGPPHSMHLIAKGVKQKTGLPWLADFRDPWTNIDFAGDLKMSSFAKKRNEVLESQVLNQADLITVVSNLMQEEFRTKTSKPVEAITNGFDPDDFEVSHELLRNDEKFSIVHTGSLNDRRNQPMLWKALAELRNELPGFSEKLCIRLIGKNDHSVRSSIEEWGLSDVTEWIDYIPHVQIIAEQKSAAVLLLAINNYGETESKFFSPKATLTGKLFEYLASGRPILMVGPTDAQAASVIKQCDAGEVVGFDDHIEMKRSVTKLFVSFNSQTVSKTTSAIDQFSRKSLTKNLAECLNSIVK